MQKLGRKIVFRNNVIDSATPLLTMQPWEIVSAILDYLNCNYSSATVYEVVHLKKAISFRRTSFNNHDEFVRNMWKFGDLFLCSNSDSQLFCDFLLTIGYSDAGDSANYGHWLSDRKEFVEGISKIVEDQKCMVLNVSHDADTVCMFWP
jgi:hypothetical protein